MRFLKRLLQKRRLARKTGRIRTASPFILGGLASCIVLLFGACFYQLPELNNPYDPLAADTGPDTISTYKIPTKTITVDGTPDDWEGINPLIVDPVGDNIVDESGSDITEVYVAQDDTYLYWMMRLADDSPNPNGSFVYRLWISANDYEKTIGNLELDVAWNHEQDEWQAGGFEWNGNDWVYIENEDMSGAADTVIEMQFPLSELYSKDNRHVRGVLQPNDDGQHPDDTEYRPVEF